MKTFYLAIILVLTVRSAVSQTFEQHVLQHLTRHRTPGMTSFMQGVSNTTTLVSLGVPAGLFIGGAIGQDEEMRKKSLYVFETIGVSTAITLALKYTINRPRPSTQDSLIIPASDQGSPSFPSGHTSEAFAMATSLSLAYPKWYVIAPSFLWAGTVGFSRMYLGVHYPSDVLAGAIVGAGSAFLTRKINQWLFGSRENAKKLIWY
jgi:undecaprenyl-diphosphatase